MVSASIAATVGRPWVERALETIWNDLVYDRHSDLAFELDTAAAAPTVLRTILLANPLDQLYAGVSARGGTTAAAGATAAPAAAARLSALDKLAVALRSSTPASLRLGAAYSLALADATAATLAGLTADLGTVNASFWHEDGPPVRARARGP